MRDAEFLPERIRARRRRLTRLKRRAALAAACLAAVAVWAGVRGVRTAEVRAEAVALSLQETAPAAAPGAWTARINGQFLRRGDTVEGFVVTNIAADGCVVSRDGVNVRLKMRNRPARAGSP